MAASSATGVDRQRRQLRLLLPVVPTIALKDGVLGATAGGGTTASASAVGGGTIAGSMLKGGVIKGLIGAALAGVGTAGTIVAVHDIQLSTRGAASVLIAPGRSIAEGVGA